MGSRIVGNGKTIQLTVSTSGIDNGEQAEFSIFKKETDEQVDTVTGNVNNGVASADWTAKGPEADDEEQDDDGGAR